MKFKNVIGFVLMMTLLMMCFVRTNAAAEYVSATLTTDKKTITSDSNMFYATNMYCKVYSDSKYPVRFQSNGGNTSNTITTQEKTITYNVDASGTVIVSSQLNYHTVTLTGWNVDSAVKKCHGYGKVY